jgi:hypothetical protein
VTWRDIVRALLDVYSVCRQPYRIVVPDRLAFCRPYAALGVGYASNSLDFPTAAFEAFAISWP